MPGHAMLPWNAAHTTLLRRSGVCCASIYTVRNASGCPYAFTLGQLCGNAAFFAGVRGDVGKQVDANGISLDSECEAR